jgi:regulation of enolase protein 1 (concanavalin A-like superfamily)
VKSRGFEVNRYSDQFTFAYRTISGDFAITARLKTLPNVDPWAQAGVMLRKSLGADAGHVFVFGTPGNGVVVRARKTMAADTFQTLTGTATVPVWLKLQRRASVVTAFRSTDGKSWTAVQTYTLSLATDLLVGFAVASHSRTLGLTAAFDGVKIGSPNVPPAVSLTSPANGSSYTSPASVAVGATASDTDGTIAKVDFYAGTTLVGTDTTSPYAVYRTGVGPGTYVVKAVATDNAGVSTTSATRTITVSAPTVAPIVPANVAPIVSMTSPANGASFVAGASVMFTAIASDTDGTIQKVQFYLGTTLVGTDTTSPYSTTWPAVIGSHSVTAVATDNQGAVTVAAWRDFTVTATALPAKAIFKAASPADAVFYYLFEIFAAGANPSVAAPIATQNIGVPPVVAGESSADVRATIVALAPGNYVATVAAMTSEGKLRSNTFAFTR